MKFEVELTMVKKVRTVSVPRDRFRQKKTLNEKLDLIFYFGQNDFQPQELPSVSMGDVIRFKGDRYLILSLGFRKLKDSEFVLSKPTLQDVLPKTK